VSIEHVESHGLLDEPQIGESLLVRANITLGQLRPEDVNVSVIYGTAGDSDELTATRSLPLTSVQENGSGRYQFATELIIDRSGNFGYGVQILPRHVALANPAELGLITTA
jgi:starch phosphorylase